MYQWIQLKTEVRGDEAQIEEIKTLKFDIKDIMHKWRHKKNDRNERYKF